MSKPIILAFVGCYLPGYKSGGPVRSIANTVNRLGDEFDFRIVTTDRDLMDSAPYANVIIDAWNSVEKAKVFYVSPQNRSLIKLARLVRQTPHDILYLNSYFDPIFTVKLLFARYLRLIPKTYTVVAPRGVFSSGALGLKWLKKRIFIETSRILCLCGGVVMQASNEFEEMDIRLCFGKDIRIMVAPDLALLPSAKTYSPLRQKKTKNCLRIISLSRITPMKNLLGALTMLDGLEGQVDFNIYGPVEDEIYWGECQKLIQCLPGNIVAKYCGSLAHEQVMTAFEKNDLFLLPTLGENFGHVILEALCAGSPVLISDQTPWRGLDKIGIGWDLPLNRPELFKKALQSCINMGSIEYEKMSEKAHRYGLQIIRDGKMVDKNRLLFQGII